MELYVNGRVTKHLYVGWMKKVQVTGQQYNYQFYSDLTGTNRNDLVKIIRPGSGPKSSHTVDLKEGEDVLVLTENLMEVYSIKTGILRWTTSSPSFAYSVVRDTKENRAKKMAA